MNQNLVDPVLYLCCREHVVYSIPLNAFPVGPEDPHSL